MLYEKAVSKKQQRFFGIVRAAQKGTLEGEASPQVQRAASNMTKSDVKKMASTKHKGLPEKKVVKETSYSINYKSGKGFDAKIDGTSVRDTIKDVKKAGSTINTIRKDGLVAGVKNYFNKDTGKKRNISKNIDQAIAGYGANIGARAATKESFATDKYKEVAKREADLKRKEDLKVKSVKKEDMAMNEVLGGIPGDGYLGHPNLNIKNPFAKKQIKKQVMPGSQGGGLINQTAGKLGDRNMMLQKLMNQSFNPEGEMTEAKYEKGASNYGKASIRNKRMFGKGGNAAPPEERGAAIQARKTRHQERRHVKKGNKYHEPGKHRPEVYGVNKPEEERKGKNVKEGTKYGLYKGDGKVKFKLNKPEKKKEKELKEYSPNISYQAKGGKKSGKLGKSSVYSLRDKDESKKDFRKSHTKDIKDGLMKKESIFTPLVFTTERLGGKGYSRKATKGGGDWPDSDRGAGNKSTRRAGGKVKAKSPTYLAHVKNKKKVKEEVTSVYEGVLSKFGKKKEKKVEKKPEKAMDAGARGRRLLQRREYKAKVSEFVPKELEDQYTPNGELVSELDLKKVGSAVWNKTTNILSKLNQKRKDNAAARKKWRDENPGGTISKQTHLNQIRNQGGDTSHWEEKSLTVDEAKVDAGKSPETKEKDRNVRKFGVSHNVAGHGKLRRSLHKMNRGDKKIKGDKSAWTEMESMQYEATRLKKEKGYDKGGTKKPSGKKDAALAFVLDKIRKEHGKGAVMGQGSKQQKKVKGTKSDAGTGKYKKAADAKKQTASEAKKRGFKSTQDYVNTIARHGGKDNYDKGRGLGT